MQFGGIKLKIEPPAKFSGGTKDNYEDFEKRLRTYLSLIDPRFPRLLKWALQQGMPITTESMTVSYFRRYTTGTKGYHQESDEPFPVLHAGLAD